MRNPRLIFAKERTVTGMEETIVRFWRRSCDCCFPAGPRSKPRTAIRNPRGVATIRGNPQVRYLGNLGLCPKLAHFNERVPMSKNRPGGRIPLSWFGTSKTANTGAASSTSPRAALSRKLGMYVACPRKQVVRPNSSSRSKGGFVDRRCLGDL
jgi:hypothetical protein